MTGERVGVGHDGSRGTAYVQGWLKALEQDPKEMYKAAADAQNISDYLMRPIREREQATEKYAAGRSPQISHAPPPQAAQQPERLRAATADVGIYRAGLIEEHEATGPHGHTFTVLTATARGKDAAHRAALDTGHVHEQQTWSGLVKPAELSHDTAVYRAALDERARIEADGGRVVRVRLDAELKAIVASATEKARAEAGDRAAGDAKAAAAHALGLPVHDNRVMYPDAQLDIGHGTTTLFAALNVLEGTVIGSCHARHRHQEFWKFLNVLDADTPADVDVHAIVDNYATHKHPAIQRWLQRHLRFHLHFIPTSASWLNLVEVWFAHLTKEQIRRGDFLGVRDLIDAIQAYIHTCNQQAGPFLWTAPAERILEKVMKCRAVSESLH